MGQELLNLAARRGLLYRVLDRNRPPAAPLQDLRAVLCADPDAHSPEWTSALTRFAESGGLLIVPRALDAGFGSGRPLSCPVAGFAMRSVGKGRVASATRDHDDPYFLAADTHALVSRRNDPVRLFNARSLWQHWGVAGDGRAAMLQLVGFTGKPNGNIVAAPAKQWRSAVAHVPGESAPRPVEPVKVDGVTEYRLPEFSYYIAVEFAA
jgi:hypothetical protein